MNAVAQIQAYATKEAGEDIYQIDLACHVLVSTLEKIHGGKWRAALDLEADFVIVRRMKDKAIQPKCGEVV